MTSWPGVSTIEIVGYLASAMVFLTFCMHTMLPLRIAAIASNLLFIVYGLAGGLYPILALHTVLLPMNVWRTVETVRLARRVRGASRGSLSLDWLKPFSSSITLRSGEVLFASGDAADHLYFIIGGQIALDGIDVVLGPGELLGEMGLFAPDRRRTRTARCLQDAQLLRIAGQDIERLCVMHPQVAFALLRVITRRLLPAAQGAEPQPPTFPRAGGAS